MSDGKYIHDELCDLDGLGECDCYVSLLIAKDEQIKILQRAALDILDEYEAVAGRHINVTELTFMPSKEDRRDILAAKVAKFRKRILEGNDVSD